MGYDLHITRRENWSDEDSEEAAKISFEEWDPLGANDPDMRMDNFAEVNTTSGDYIWVRSKGLSVWIKYSENWHRRRLRMVRLLRGQHCS